MNKKKSFLERITGKMKFEDDEEDFPITEKKAEKHVEVKDSGSKKESWADEEEDAQLSVDVYQTPNDIIVQTMIAGVLPDNLSITITRDIITVRGKREENHAINNDNYFVQELYWGSFSRTISLPEEVDPEEAEAIEKHGLLIIKLPKINKEKKTTLKVKSV
jgi:HSP20 family protein